MQEGRADGVEVDEAMTDAEAVPEAAETTGATAQAETLFGGPHDQD